MNNQAPFISTIIVARNEEAYIEKSLGSLLCQDYPTDKYEIIIVDGESEDKTIENAKNLIERERKRKANVPSILFLKNPKRLLASGWNIAIKAAKGEYVIRIDAHAEAASSFLSKSVETMLSVDAVCVGGRLYTKPLNDKGKEISDVLSSPFGVGNSSFRVSDTSGYVDTAVYGLYKKKILEKVGFFDESLARNQDIECHTRIKKVGGRFYFNPEIKCIYYSRSSTKKMMQQAFQNGRWNLISVRKNNARLSLRHLVPLFFFLFIVVATLLGFLWQTVWYVELGILCCYIALAFVFSLKKTHRPVAVLKMMGLFLLLHMSYGAGSFAGIFSKT